VSKVGNWDSEVGCGWVRWLYILMYVGLADEGGDILVDGLGVPRSRILGFVCITGF